MSENTPPVYFITQQETKDKSDVFAKLVGVAILATCGYVFYKALNPDSTLPVMTTKPQEHPNAPRTY